MTAGDPEVSAVHAQPLRVEVPEHFAKAAIKIAIIRDPDLRGEMVMYRKREGRLALEELAAKERIAEEREELAGTSALGRWKGGLIRGGFRIGDVPGLPVIDYRLSVDAIVETLGVAGRGIALPATNLARSRLVGDEKVARGVFGSWFPFLLEETPGVADGLGAIS
jgi:hypothetical protein